jgi:hypothetical protein
MESLKSFVQGVEQDPNTVMFNTQRAGTGMNIGIIKLDWVIGRFAIPPAHS